MYPTVLMSYSLKKYAATARLSCMAEIEGDCSIAVLPAQTGPVSV